MSAVAPDDAAVPQAGPLRMISPTDGRVYLVDSAKGNDYTRQGWQSYRGPNVESDSILAKLSDWREKGRAAVLGAANNLPLVNTAIDRFASPDTAQAYASQVATSKAEHPGSYYTGAVAGGIGGIAALGGVGGIALKASGVGAALGEAAGAVGLGARATKLLGGAASGAALGGASDVASQIDEAALNHAASPEGQEKLVVSYSRALKAAALGAAVPAVSGGVVAGIGKLGRTLEEKGEQGLINSLVDKEGQANLQAQGKGHVVDSLLKPIGLEGRSGGKVTETLYNRIHSATTDINHVQAKFGGKRLSTEGTKEILEAAEKHLAGSAEDSSLNPLRDAIEKGSGPTIPELRDVYQKIYSAVNFKDVSGNPRYAEFMAGGRAVSEGTRKLIEEHGTPKLLQDWNKALNEFSDWHALLQNLSGKSARAVGEVAQKAKDSGVTGAVLGTFGVKGGGPIGGAVTSAAWNLLHYGDTRFLSFMTNRVGAKLAKADKAVAGAITAGLYGVPTADKALHETSYDDLASRVAQAQHMPLKAFGAFRTHLQDDGVPDHIADGLALRGHQVLQQGAQWMPKRQTSPDFASNAQPDPVARRKWLGQMRSAMDPSYALQFPTVSNMDAAKQFHPETIARAQGIIHDHVARNPDMPSTARMWASRVMGRPLGGLNSPTFYQSLTQQRAAATQAAQGGQGPQGPKPSRQRSNGPSPMAQSEQTRLGELAGP